MRYIKIKIIFLVILFGCNKSIKTIIKSSDSRYILEKAIEFEKDKRYEDSIDLYEHLSSITKGDVSLAKEVLYRKAWANYHQGNYLIASGLFSNFHSLYKQDTRAKESLFQSAYCYFLLSPDYNLDQEYTHKAIDQFQYFTRQYPYLSNEDESKINDLMGKLREKLEKKAFYLAKGHFDLLRYKESIIVFNEFIYDFPESSRKEQVKVYILESYVEYALRSTQAYKKERALKALEEYEEFKLLYPNSNFRKKVEVLKEKLTPLLKA